MNAQIRKSLNLTWNWFRKSGVMLPDDGSWGVAERVMLPEGNSAKERTLRDFSPWTPHKDHYIIEQRRADCCMETAWLFFLMSDLFGKKVPYAKTAENILDFLYFRSGLLNRKGNDSIIGAWDWSHARRGHLVYFDDDAWMVTLALKIARKYPRLDTKYDMTHYAMLLADHISAALPVYFADDHHREEDFAWLGDVKLPHWGSLACMALAEAYKVWPKKEYSDTIDFYEKYLLNDGDKLSKSEFCYALIGCSMSFRATGSRQSLGLMRHFADNIVDSMNPETGAIPSEHYEAPAGKGLADTIYTMNWALLGLQNMASLDPAYQEPYGKVRDLLLSIQDLSKPKHLHGCWRGMYDMETGKWGGGDCHEGGANSIYTGWTNAPIPWGLAMDQLKTCLADY